MVFILFADKYFDAVLVCRNFALWKKRVEPRMTKVEFPIAKEVGALKKNLKTYFLTSYTPYVLSLWIEILMFKVTIQC